MHLRPKSKASLEHWSKDFAEHLRTVHFALITTSAALILILTSRVYDLRAAAGQMDTVVKLNAAQPQVREPRLITAPATKAATFSNDSFTATIDGTNEKVRFQIKPNFYRCDKPHYLPFDPKRRATNLSSFRFDWNNFPHKAFAADSVTSLETSGRIFREEREGGDLRVVGKLTIDTPSTTVSENYSSTIYLTLDENCDDLDDHLQQGNLRVSGSDLAGRTFAFKVTGLTRSSILPPQSDDEYALRHRIMVYPSWRVRARFDDDFPDLAKAAKGRMNEDFATLLPELHAEANKGDEAFEAFGIKFPSEQVTRWGMIVLVCIQLYLFIYLKRLSSKLKSDDSAWDVPWLAMDQSMMAMGILFVSIVILPIAATLLLLDRAMLAKIEIERQGLDQHLLSLATGQLILISIGACISVALAILSWKYRPKLSEPQVPWQRFE